MRAWELRLGRVSETLAAWLGVQRRWMYLEAIFSCSDDLRQQLAQVGMLHITCHCMHVEGRAPPCGVRHAQLP